MMNIFYAVLLLSSLSFSLISAPSLDKAKDFMYQHKQGCMIAAAIVGSATVVLGGIGTVYGCQRGIAYYRVSQAFKRYGVILTDDKQKKTKIYALAYAAYNNGLFGLRSYMDVEAARYDFNVLIVQYPEFADVLAALAQIDKSYINNLRSLSNGASS